MRGDETAQYVATRPYKDGRERNNALYAHAKRVMRARLSGQGDPLGDEPALAVSGTIIFRHGPAECRIAHHGAAKVFYANSDTHRVLNRNGEACATWLCVRHWSEYKREEGDDPGLPVAEVQYSPALEA